MSRFIVLWLLLASMLVLPAPAMADGTSTIPVPVWNWHRASDVHVERRFPHHNNYQRSGHGDFLGHRHHDRRNRAGSGQSGSANVHRSINRVVR